MNKSNGFTLSEMLLCLSTVIILSTYCLSTVNIETVSLDSVVYQIIETIEQAKVYALAYNQNVTICLSTNSISCQLENDNMSYQWDKSIDLQEKQTITYNNQGHINSATTVNICNKSECKSIVFHLESGHINVQ